MSRAMIFFLAVVALVVVLVYFYWQRRHGDAIWSRYRERRIARMHRPRLDQPPDPNFDFGDAPDQRHETQ